MRTDPTTTATTRAGAAPGFTHEERISRRHAAERLVDIAYALTAGATLELRTQGEHVSVPVPDEVVLRRASATDGERVDLHIQLSWSGTRTPDDHRNSATRP